MSVMIILRVIEKKIVATSGEGQKGNICVGEKEAQNIGYKISSGMYYTPSGT